MFWIFSIFSRYSHPFERKTEKFFRWVNSRRDSKEIQKRLLNLMQENLLVLNVWLEKRFKNYRYLTKRGRRKMYKNTEAIMLDFKRFLETHTPGASIINTELRGLGFDPADYQNCMKELQYLRALMMYLNPAGRLQYQKECTFGKLLVDPSKKRMTGDCNQIVTLYAFLFSRAFPIDELQVKLIPGHICLHFRGIDIETTKGVFRNYQQYDYIAPVSELISTNVLDISDPTEAVASISAETFVKSSQIAFAISSKRDIVEYNLKIAYRKLCIESLRQRDFEKARFYADKLGDRKIIETCYAYEFNELAKKIKHVKTISEARQYKTVYERLIALSKNMGDKTREQSLRKILERL